MIKKAVCPAHALVAQVFERTWTPAACEVSLRKTPSVVLKFYARLWFCLLFFCFGTSKLACRLLCSLSPSLSAVRWKVGLHKTVRPRDCLCVCAWREPHWYWGCLMEKDSAVTMEELLPAPILWKQNPVIRAVKTKANNCLAGWCYHLQ